MEKKNPEPIKKIIDVLLENLKDQKILKEDIVRKVWEKAVGVKALKHTKVASLKSGRLVVEVDESAWIYQLTLKKSEILKKINKHLKDVDMKEIQFRISNLS